MAERRWRMGERRWWMDHVSEHGDVYDWMTDAEMLAEMPTEALVEELKRRGFQPITDEASFVEWLRSMKENG